MVANIFFLADTPGPGDGSMCQNSTFLEHGLVAYQFKVNHFMQQHGSKKMPTDPYPPPLPPPTLGMGSVGQNSTSSEHGHVTYQIKENHECSNMVANILPADTPDPGNGVNRSKFNLFKTWSCCVSK